jgi:hypothetical protein
MARKGLNEKFASIDYNGLEVECSNVLATSKNLEKTTVSTITTAGVAALTAAQVLGGLILRDCAGAGRADTPPTAAQLMAVLGTGVPVGTSFRFTIRNTSDGAETITISAATGVTLSGTMTIAQNNSKDFLVVVTSATAYTLYSLGTVVH